ncbi:MAG: ABC transporter ATP-binding protein [Clostridia bacterium]|nr:ABC transporter ATP-binding protein [Clostridia bacterium]
MSTPKGPMRGPGGGPGGRGVFMAGGKAKNFKGTLSRLLGYLKPYRIGIIFILLCILLATLFNTLAPKILGDATTLIFHGVTEKTGIDFGGLFRILVMLGGVYLLHNIFSYFQQVTMAQVAQKTMYSLRRDVDEKLARLPLRYFDSKTFGEILSRVTNDVDTISNSLQQSLTQVVSSVITIVMLLVMMLSVSPTLTLIALISLPFSALISTVVVKKTQKYFKGQQRSLGELNGHIEEMYSGHNVVKLFGREQAVKDTFDQINEELYKNSKTATFASSIMMPLTSLVGNIGYVVLCVVGGMMVAAKTIEIGGVQAFIQYLRQFNQPISQVANIANILQSTVAAAERVFELLDEEEEVKETAHPKTLSHIDGSVSFRDVSFGYSADKILIKNLNLTIDSGETVAIVGPTGAGKTTLVNLLMRFYELNGGAICVDGVDTRDFSREYLRNIFGMVLQDTWLFRGSIRENLAYGKENATEEEIIQAAKAAHAHSFIKLLPGGYDFVLNEEASNISQGQKQLLTIARAILKDPEILILDEATSSVDTRTEVLIQKAMKNLMKNRTSFVIAHRLSTIRDADKILVMRDGDIIEHGNHASLMAEGGFYANLYNSQFAQNNQA